MSECWINVYGDTGLFGTHYGWKWASREEADLACTDQLDRPSYRIHVRMKPKAAS